MQDQGIRRDEWEDGLSAQKAWDETFLPLIPEGPNGQTARRSSTKPCTQTKYLKTTSVSPEDPQT